MGGLYGGLSGVGVGAGPGIGVPGPGLEGLGVGLGGVWSGPGGGGPGGVGLGGVGTCPEFIAAPPPMLPGAAPALLPELPLPGLEGLRPPRAMLRGSRAIPPLATVLDPLPRTMNSWVRLRFPRKLTAP